MWRRVIAVSVLVAVLAGGALADNTFFVESKEVIQGQAGTVGAYLSNDVALRSMSIPLVVRAVTPGCYPTTLAAEYTDGGHLSGYLTEIRFMNIYDNEDGNCKAGQPGGFSTITISSGSNRVVHPSPSDPDGFGLTRQLLFGPALPPGADGTTPSIAFDFTAPLTTGSFEIDSTCRDPAGHLTFVTTVNEAIVPAFTKGTIDVVECDCPHQGDFDADGFLTALDVGALIDVLFAGRTDVRDPGCPSTRADFDCDGFATAMDLGVFIDHLFAGGSLPCDPCYGL